jgi:hypothetical protein
MSLRDLTGGGPRNLERIPFLNSYAKRLRKGQQRQDLSYMTPGKQ